MFPSNHSQRQGFECWLVYLEREWRVKEWESVRRRSQQQCVNDEALARGQTELLHGILVILQKHCETAHWATRTVRSSWPAPSLLEIISRNANSLALWSALLGTTCAPVSGEPTQVGEHGCGRQSRAWQALPGDDAGLCRGQLPKDLMLQTPPIWNRKCISPE